MAKLKLTLSPTFKAKVAIPVPGSKPVDVEFTFKARKKTEFKDFVEGLRDRDDNDVIMDIACGWELEDAFDAKSVADLTENYIGAASAVITTYLREHTAARSGN